MKTTVNNQSVKDFINRVDEHNKRQDCYKIIELMSNLTNEEAKMWGDNIVGFGKYHYKYESGREGDFFLTGFSPRKQNLTLYIVNGFSEYDDLMQNLGKYKTGKSCLYIKKLDDINLEVLEELIKHSLQHLIKLYPSV